MNKTIAFLKDYNYTGGLEKDLANIYENFDSSHTLIHVKAVTQKALEIAENFDADKDKVFKAAMLHDLAASRLFPNPEKVQVARELGIEEIRDDDLENPIMLHGKISAELARKYFGVDDEDTLNAMKYHTTLRPNASIVEQIVFIADKIAIDPSEKHNAEYMEDVKNVVNDDVTKACWYYLKWMFDNMDWLESELGWQRHYNAVAAYNWLNSIYGKND